MKLLQMSLSAALLIVIIAVARSVLMNRLPKRTFTLLWMVALFRIILPISIPSKFSIYTWIGQSLSVVNAIQSSHVSALLPETGTMLMAPTGASSNAANMLGANSVWTVIWIIGLIVCSLFFAVIYLAFYLRFQSSFPVDNEFTRHWLSTHRIHRPVAIRQSNRISSPLTYGFFRPIILIPKDTVWENKEQLNYIFEHEYIHICRNDFITKLMLTAAVCIHWFNPVVWVMYILFNRDMEIVCDEAVIKKSGMDSRLDYATMLIDLEERRSNSLSPCSYFSKNAIEERIVAIMKSKHYSSIYHLASIALVLCVVFCFSTSALASTIDNDTTSQTDNSWVWPTLSKEISLGFGEHTHPITGQIFNYDHMYIAGTKDDPVVSSTSGVVSQTGFDSEYGYYIVVTGADDISVLYGQLNEILVKDGTRVAAGEQIGSLGATGKVAGDCLAYAVFDGGIAVDPLSYID